LLFGGSPVGVGGVCPVDADLLHADDWMRRLPWGKLAGIRLPTVTSELRFCAAQAYSFLLWAERMLPFKLVYSEGYYLPIGQHVFPAQKYRLVYQRLISSGLAEAADFLEPKPASDKDILLVHTSEYVYRLQYGMLSAAEELQMEIPYSEELVDSFWLAAGGSIMAANRAMEDRVAINIGGGFHHAFPNHGEGFCMIHDVAVAIRRLQKDGKIKRAMVVDCDVHQGNGTAVIFGNKQQLVQRQLPSWGADVLHNNPALVTETGAADVFTISLHQQNNYPAVKPPSSIDVNLPDHTTDDQYLGWLDNALSSGLRQFEPELLCYVAGADPYKEDQLGGLDLTIEGLRRRDELVFQVAAARNIPIMVTYAGGYANRVEDTITIHCNTVAAAKQVYSGHGDRGGAASPTGRAPG
jgi:acetoin utilization deacetylase AcuC-like enzyme